MATREDVLSTQETFLKEVADAIRDKDGTNELIAPVDFPSRIRAISTTVVGEGGGFPAGGSMNQALMKNSQDDGDVRWGNVVVTFNGRSGFVYPQEGDYTADEVGAVPVERRVNGQTLESDIWLTAEDVGAASDTYVDQKLAPVNQKLDAADARFDNAESLIAGNTKSVSDLQKELASQVAQLKALIDQMQSSKVWIAKGTTPLVSGVSSLDTDTIYVQYEP